MNLVYWKAVKEFFKPDKEKIIIFCIIITIANLPSIGTYNPHEKSVFDANLNRSWNFTLYELNPLFYAPFVIVTEINNRERILFPQYPLLNQLLVLMESLRYHVLPTGPLLFMSTELLYLYFLSSLASFLWKIAIKKIKKLKILSHFFLLKA